MKLPGFAQFSHLTKKIGIDLGTSMTRIWTDEEGIVLEEPSCIAIERNHGKVIAVGKEAEEMIGRVQPHIEIFHPIQAGVIMQAEITTAMLRVFLQQVFRTPYFFRPIMMISLPSNSTEVEKMTVNEMLYTLGAREVYFIDQVVAAAIGAGVPIADASGSFLIQFGAGLVEGGIISLGSLVVAESTEYAGEYFDKVIQRVVRKEKLINIGMRTATFIKHHLLTLADESGKSIHISGQDVIDVVPKEVTLDVALFRKSLDELMEKYIVLVRKLLNQIPSELTTDIIDKGILLSGGGAQLPHLDTFLISVLGVPVSVVETPDKAVIKGVAQVLQNLELFKESIGYKE